MSTIYWNECPFSSEYAIKNIEFDSKAIDASVVQHRIEKYPDEQIIGTVFGILRTAASVKEYFRSFSYSGLGSGKRYFPENTLLITNYRLLFIQIPISGGNKIVGGTDYVTQNFLFNRAELREKGKEVMKTHSLSKILSHAKNDVLWTDIKTLTLKQGQIIIEKITGLKLIYNFRDREYIDLLKQLFRFYLKERLVER